MRCAENHGPLLGAPEGPDRCEACGGEAAPFEWLGQRWPRAGAALQVETRESAAAYQTTLGCPSCDATTTPLRLDRLEVWAYRCPSCETTWMPRGVATALARFDARARTSAHMARAPEDDRRAIARALAAAQPPPRIREPVSTAHLVLALLGFPVVTGTERMREPLATWLLSLGLVAVFLGQVAFGSLYESVELLAYRGADGSATQLLTAVVSHAGWLHLLGNVYFLVAFGDGVEQYLPRWLVVAAFFVLGAVTLLAEAAWSGPGILLIGASGGVAVLMGACAVLQPRATVVTRIVVIVVPIRIVWYIALEIALQGLMAWRGVPGVAWTAHLAGLALGLVLGAVARRVWGRAFA